MSDSVVKKKDGRTGHAQLSLLQNHQGKRRARSFNPADLTKAAIICPAHVLAGWLRMSAHMQLHPKEGQMSVTQNGVGGRGGGFCGYINNPIGKIYYHSS